MLYLSVQFYSRRRQFFLPSAWTQNNPFTRPCKDERQQRENSNTATEYLVLARRNLHLQLRTLAMDHWAPDCVSVRPVICQQIPSCNYFLQIYCFVTATADACKTAATAT